MITGKTPDISEYLDFNFYDLVWYWRQPSPSLSEHDRELARWMGVAHRVGSDMCYWLMPVSGVPVVNSSVQHVTAEDLRNPEIMQQIDDLNRRLETQLDDTSFVLPGGDIDDFYPNDIYDMQVLGNAKNRDPENGNNVMHERPEANEKCSKPEAYCLSPLSGQKITKDRLRTEVGIGING
jgi:hypothetical protein